MAASDGPITGGFRREIGTSKMTPYAIAKAVTAREKVKLTPAQIYKFQSGKMGLSLAILDEIAIVLELMVQKPKATPLAIPAPESGRAAADSDGMNARRECPGIEECPEIALRPGSPGHAAEGPQAPVPTPRNSLADETPEEARARRAARREQRRQRRTDPERTSLQDQIQKMKSSLDARRAARGPRSSLLNDEPQAPLTPKAPIPRSTNGDDDSLDNYVPPSEEAQRTRTMGSVNAREITQQIQTIAPKITNPGMQALAETYGGPGRSGSGMEKAKFFRFVSQMRTNNPHFAAIMRMPDLVDRFKEVAAFMPDPENVGRVADVISPADLWPASENPEEFKENLKRLLASQGVVNGVVDPSRGPPPGYC